MVSTSALDLDMTSPDSTFFFSKQGLEQLLHGMGGVRLEMMEKFELDGCMIRASAARELGYLLGCMPSLDSLDLSRNFEIFTDEAMLEFVDALERTDALRYVRQLRLKDCGISPFKDAIKRLRNLCSVNVYVSFDK